MHQFTYKEIIIKHVMNDEYIMARKIITEVIIRVSYKKNMHYPLIAKAINYIDENYNKKIKLGEVAEHVGFSKEYMCRIFKDSMGVSYNDYLNFVRAGRAEQMLLQTDMTVKSISEGVGLVDPGYFSRIFKKFNGCTPNEFRKDFTN